MWHNGNRSHAGSVLTATPGNSDFTRGRQRAEQRALRSRSRAPPAPNWRWFSQLFPLPLETTQAQTGYLASLTLNFLICQMGSNTHLEVC